MSEWIKFQNQTGHFLGIYYHDGKIMEAFYHGCYSSNGYRLFDLTSDRDDKQPEYIYNKYPNYPERLLEKVSVYKNKIRKEKLKKINDDIRRLEMDIEKLEYEKNKLVEEQKKEEEMQGVLTLGGESNEGGALSITEE